MTNATRISALSVIAAALIATIPMSATAGTYEPGFDQEISKTIGMDIRDDRRDDRQDCRQAEGVVGDDKRDCKQTNR